MTLPLHIAADKKGANKKPRQGATGAQGDGK